MDDDTPQITVIPEPGGTVLIQFCSDPSRDTAVGLRSRVIAWVVSVMRARAGVSTFVDPVTAEGFADAGTWCLEERDETGIRWIFPGECTCDSYAEALEQAAASLRADEARRAKKRAGA